MPVFKDMSDFWEAKGDAVIESDESLVINLGSHAPRKSPEVQLNSGKRAAQPSALEQAFLAMWEILNGPQIKPEHVFHESRRWRADFAHIDSRVLIEVEGGTWSNGRHNRGQGYQGDCEKYNAATLDGWRVFRFTKEMIQPDALEQVIEFIGQNPLRS